MNPLTLNPLQIKLALIAGGLVVIALLGLTSWALLERSGRLECKVDLVRSRDQVDVLAKALKEQTASILELGQATARARGELRAIIDKIAADNRLTRDQVAQLERSLNAPTPKAADGRVFDCRDALRIWREELAK